MSFITRIAAGAALTVATLGSVQAGATTAFDYNLFVSGNMAAANSDVEGRVAVGGSAALSGYSIGITSSGPAADLVVGGSLAANNGTVWGSTKVGGAAALGGGWTSNGGTVSEGVSPLPIDFSAEAARVLALSNYWSTLTATGTAVKQYSTLTLTGAGASAVQVFNVTSLSGISTLNIKAAAGKTVLVNIAGTSAEFKNMGISLSGGVTRSNVLYNFYDATALNITGIDVAGSVMAPKADMTNGSGQINGQVFVKNFNSGIQINDVKYTGSVPTPPAVPEPATWAMMIGGFALAGVALRRRAARVAIA